MYVNKDKNQHRPRCDQDVINQKKSWSWDLVVLVILFFGKRKDRQTIFCLSAKFLGVLKPSSVIRRSVRQEYTLDRSLHNMHAAHSHTHS